MLILRSAPAPASGGGGGGGGNYDIEAKLTDIRNDTGTEFDSLVVATGPSITTEATVTDLSGFTTSIGVNGRRTIIPDGVTITLTSRATLSGNDKEIELRGTARIVSSGDNAGNDLFATGTRIRIIGSSGSLIRVPIGGGSGITDYQLWGVNQDTSAVTDAENNVFAPTRFNALHCSLISDKYALFLHNSGASRPVDSIIANTYFNGGTTTASLVRTSNENRGVWIDSRFWCDSAAHTYRKHGGSTPAAGPDKVYTARCDFVGSGLWITANPAGDTDLTSQATDIWYKNNHLYPRTGESVTANFQVSDQIGANSPPPGSTPDQHNNVTITGNRNHTNNAWLGYPTSNFPNDWTVSDNTNEGQDDPPAWSRAQYAALPPDYVTL